MNIGEKEQQNPFSVAIIGGGLSSHGGGAPRSMAQQGRALTDAGCKVTFFAGHSKKYPPTPKELEIEHITSYTSQLWGPSILGIFPKAMFQLWKLTPQIDIIHLNGAWNFTTFIAGRIAHLRKTPYIISCRSHFGDYHFSRMPFLKKILFSVFEKTNIRDAYALHVTADWEKKTSWRAVQRAKRIIKIPNPVNLNDFKNPPLREESRKHLKLNPEGFYVVHLGRLGKQKNLPFLLRSFHKANLGPSAHLILVGPPETTEKNNLITLSKELGLQNQVTYVDFAKGRERCHWLAAADLFALPSHDENFCIAAIEAIAAGTHCLLSPQVGAIEYLPDQYLTICKNHPDEWENALSNLFKNRKNQQIPSSDSFSMFSEEAITDLWIEQYKELDNE